MSRCTLLSILVFFAFTIFAVSGFAAPCPLNTANPSITICSPAANASVANPVTISAGSTDSAGVIAMAIYVDNTLVQKVNGGEISTTASFGAGSHYLVVQLWDNAGRIIKQPEYFTVTTSTVPTISFSANPASITAGQSSTLSWSTSNATSVTIDNGIGSQPTSGSIAVSPAATTTYTLTATGPGGTSTARATVTVGTSGGGTCSPSSPAPSVTICSPTNGSTVPSPVHVLAVPNSNNGVIAMAVYFDNNLVYKGNVNKVDQLINASTGAHYVVVQFWDNNGNVPAKASANITVGTSNPLPTISFSASPTSINSGQSSTLTWTTSNATSVTIDNGVGSVATSGAVTVSPTATTTYTLTATGPGGTATATATVTVGSGTTPPTASFSANPTSITAGQSSTLTWSTTNATTVSIDNGIGTVAASGTRSVSPSATTTYTLTAAGAGGTTTAQATVTVGTTTSCTPALSAPSVTICSPANGSTVSSPVHVLAVPNSNNGVIAMAVYFDNTLKYKANVNKVDTLINTTTGSHYIVVQFWDKSGNVPAKASVNITVGTTSSGLVVSPSNATVLINDTQQFTATNDGASVPVTWSIDGLPSGNGTVGTIDANGIYTAPSSTGSHQVKAVSTSNSSLSGTATVNVVSQSVAVTTYHNDGQRTGANLRETILKPSNVNSSSFGKLASYSVDGQVYAQPLYVPNLTINGSAHNVLYIATEHDSVYAFDADGKTSTPLWKVSLLGPGQTTVSSGDGLGIKPEIGVTSTPVIDINNNVIYVVAEVDNGGANQFWLHALDLHTGAERFGGPKRVTATVPGTGADSVNGQITLSGGCYQRSGLALGNGNIYIAFAHCSHGWVLAYNAGTLNQSAVYNTTPNGAGGTIWMGGGAPAFDGSGNVYLLTGTNFGSTANSGFNNAFMRFTPSLGLTDYFMPSNNATLVANDVDLGAGGPMILPDNSSSHPHEIVGAGKDGRIFLIDRDNMGKFDPNTDHVIQEIQSGTQQWNNFHDTPAYWNGNLYYHSNADVLRQFKWSNGLLSASSVGPDVFNAHGATPSVSANGNSNGIVWELKLDGQPSSPAILYAYDATNVANVLYKSSTNSADAAPNAVKFTVPTIVNGKVYVAGGGQVAIYGLK